MPDNFQDYSHFSHPSPSVSSDAHSSNDDATSTTSSGVGPRFTEWSRDYDLDALYSSEFMAGMTEEELMECLANIPVDELLPEPQTIPPYLLQGSRPAQNVHNSTSSALRPMMVAQPNLSNLPFNAVSTWTAGQPQQFFSSPPPAPSSSRQLPSLCPVMIPTSPSSQTSSRSSVGPAGDTQRLSLPAPGDMNCSSCEVIM